MQPAKKIKLMSAMLLNDELLSASSVNSAAINMQILNTIRNRQRAQMDELALVVGTARVQHFRIPDFYEKWLDRYVEYDFYIHFRMTRATMVKLTTDLGCVLHRPVYRGGLPPIDFNKVVLIVIWYIAKGDSMVSVGDRFDVATSTVYNCISSVLKGLSLIMPKYIFWPTKDECAVISREFFKISGYPDAIGAIDGCKVKCKIPLKQHDSYQDRHLDHSVTIQGVATASRILTNIFVGFPGAAHDARVLSESGLYQTVVDRGSAFCFFNKYHLLGDKAYPCKTWLMTPYKDNGRLTRQQKTHNYKLSAARVVIEHVFGQIKGRWRICQYINTYSVKRAVQIIVASCVLHNFCLLSNDDFNHDLWEEMLPEEEVEHNRENQYDDDGLQKRTTICEQLSLN